MTRRFQIEQRDAGVPTPTMNSIVSALQFFFTHTIDRPDLARKVIRVAHPYSARGAESGRGCDCSTRPPASNMGSSLGRLWRWPARGGGRGAQGGHVDSERMLIRVERQGGRYRNAMLPADLPCCAVVEGRA
jgi:hypothetical protein